MAAYRFLVDHDCHRVAELLPRALTLADVGLPENAADQRIVEAAWDNRCIIVSANGRDFLEEVGRFLRTTKKNDCHELWGLVVVPNDFESQKRLLARTESRLHFDLDTGPSQPVDRARIDLGVEHDATARHGLGAAA